jgi:hypothetical protein
MHKALLLALATAELAVAVGMSVVVRASVRTGTPFRDVRGARPLVLISLLLAAGLWWVALTI